MTEGEDYWFFDNLLTESGYYTAVIEGEECDSVVGLNLFYPMDAVTEASEPDNRADALLRLSSDTANLIDKVEIRNLLGQTVLRAGSTDSIDLSGLENGIYFLMTCDKNGRNRVTKIIKE